MFRSGCRNNTEAPPTDDDALGTGLNWTLDRRVGLFFEGLSSAAGAVRRKLSFGRNCNKQYYHYYYYYYYYYESLIIIIIIIIIIIMNIIIIIIIITIKQ